MRPVVTSYRNFFPRDVRAGRGSQRSTRSRAITRAASAMSDRHERVSRPLGEARSSAARTHRRKRAEDEREGRALLPRAQSVLSFRERSVITRAPLRRGAEPR